MGVRGLTCSVAQVGLELQIFLSISQVPGLLACTTMLGIHFLKIITLLFLDVVVIPIYGGHSRKVRWFTQSHTAS